MTSKQLFFVIAFFVTHGILAQRDSISLPEVVVTDAQLREFSTTRIVQTLNDSVLRNNSALLTGLLQYNSTLYFKENGTGSGVASVSFRGTTAQQTAVVWNGININSQFNGQTDFNAVATSGFGSVSVRPGGGSVVYGSSAIGGSVHLENDIRFGDHLDHAFFASYGSFDTKSVFYRLDAGSDRFGVKATISRNSSANDYPFPNSDRKNDNAQFENTGLDVAAAYKLSARNTLKFYSRVFDGERHFPLLTTSDTKTKYADFNTSNLLEWEHQGARLTSKVKIAYIAEAYKFFENIANDFFYHGKAETAIAKYDVAYRFGQKILLNAVVDYTKTSARGSDIDKNAREIGSASLLYRHRLSQIFLYELGFRQEITNNYDSPLLYSAGLKFTPSEVYSVRINGSRNFRIPTFNDLYWADGGNPNLKPESSYQAEAGADLHLKNAKLSITGYYMKIDDMIQWLPGTSASWFPQNVNKVEAYGLEALAEIKKRLGRHELSANATYAYTVSKNEKTQKQLIYVPYHKATGAIGYGYRKFSATLQGLFNGEVFTRSDNNDRYNLDGYVVANAILAYDFGHENSYRVGVAARNLFDSEYYTMERRPYPGRNYCVTLTLTL